MSKERVQSLTCLFLQGRGWIRRSILDAVHTVSVHVHDCVQVVAVRQGGITGQIVVGAQQSVVFVHVVGVAATIEIDTQVVLLADQCRVVVVIIAIAWQIVIVIIGVIRVVFHAIGYDTQLVVSDFGRLLRFVLKADVPIDAHQPARIVRMRSQLKRRVQQRVDLVQLTAQRSSWVLCIPSARRLDT